MVNLAAVVLLLPYLGSAPRIEPDVEVRTELPAGPVAVGVPVEWQIHITDQLLADVGLEFPEWPSGSADGVLRRGVQGPSWSRTAGGEQQVTYRVTLVGSRPGSLRVPAATVVLEDQGLRIATDSPILEVESTSGGWSMRVVASESRLVPGQVFQLHVGLQATDEAQWRALQTWEIEEFPLPAAPFQVLSETAATEESTLTRWRHYELVAQGGAEERLAAEVGRVRVLTRHASEAPREQLLWNDAVHLTLEPLPPLPAGVSSCQGIGVFQFQARWLPRGAERPRELELSLTGPGAERAHLPDLRSLRSLPAMRSEETRSPGRSIQVASFEQPPDRVPPLLLTTFDPRLWAYRTQRVDLAPGEAAPPGPGARGRGLGFFALVLGVLLGVAGGLLKPIVEGFRRRQARRRVSRAAPEEALERTVSAALTLRLGGPPTRWRTLGWDAQLMAAGRPDLAKQAADLQRRLQRDAFGLCRAPVGALRQRALELLEALE